MKKQAETRCRLRGWHYYCSFVGNVDGALTGVVWFLLLWQIHCVNGTQAAFVSRETRATLGRGIHRPCTPSRLPRLLSRMEDDDDKEEEDRNNNAVAQQRRQDVASLDDANNGIFSRFLNPRIDDPALPLSDALVAQIIAPSLEVAWLALNRAPSPTWLQPIVPKSLIVPKFSRGSLLAPALIHGAALAVCWLAGALAARAYERDALIWPIDEGDGGSSSSQRDDPYKNSLQTSPSNRPRGAPLAVLQAGAFATGLLILGTQLDLFLEFGNRYVQLGESPETDFRIQVAVVELVNDVVFEAVTMVSWRLYLAAQQPR